jgi:hypothetical protein
VGSKIRAAFTRWAHRSSISCDPTTVRDDEVDDQPIIIRSTHQYER